MSLRVGRIGFANCTPIFRALEEGAALGPVTFVEGVPTELNRKLREGEVDLAPCSSVTYLADPDRFGFLPDLSISSIGEVASVLLFSRKPLAELNGAHIALSPASATSVMLLRILLERRDIHPKYETSFDNPDAVLWIGDRALKEARAGAWPHVYDLGQLWLEETDTPFVFALWLARRDRFDADPLRFRSFYRLLVAARQRAYRSYTRYAADSEETPWLTDEELVAYWHTISYGLTAWHLAGLRRFAEEAARLELIPVLPLLTPLPVEENPST